MNAINISVSAIRTVMDYTENPVIPAQQVLILLYVMERGEISMADLAKLARISQASISRNVALLGRGVNPQMPGYSLLDAYEDPFYRRRKLVKLTPRGEMLRKELMGIPTSLKIVANGEETV